MIAKKTVFVCIIFFIAVFAYPQADAVGIAAEDGGFAPKINSAALAAGNASGIAFSQSFSRDGFLNRFSLYFNLDNLSYGFDKTDGGYLHRISLALKADDGIFLGATGKWENSDSESFDFGISFLLYLSKYFSFGIRTTDITDPFAEFAAGFGIRPLAFSDYWGSRFTLYADSLFYNNFKENFKSLVFGAKFEPVNGVHIFANIGGIRADEKYFTVGVSLATGFASVSSEVKFSDEPSFTRGSYSLFTSGKRMRSFLNIKGNAAADYNKAPVISDFPSEPPSLFFPPKIKKISLIQFISDMQAIKNDPDIGAVVFSDNFLSLSFANSYEISQALLDLKKAGKKIYFYFEIATLPQYALAASVADGVYLAPQGSINLKGFSRTGFYLRDFLAKLGIKVYNFRSHSYKSAFNMFSESEMTNEEREALAALYSSLQTDLEEMIKTGREAKLKNNIKDIIANGPYLSARDALDAGIIDGILYKDEFNNFVNKEFFRIKYSMLPDFMQYDWQPAAQPYIKVIHVTGNIISGKGKRGENAGAESVASAIAEARNNSHVKAIVLRINSGGGSVLASDVIAREAALCAVGRNKKPLIVSMGSIAASGGYYIAAPAEKIFADPVTITGSIGVTAAYPDLSGLLEKLNIKSQTVKEFDSADAGNFTRSMSEAEINKVKKYIAECYANFLSVVSEGRKISKEEVDEAGKGRVWSARQALEKSLIDELGGISNAVKYIEEKYFNGKKAKIVEVVPGESNFSILNFLISAKEPFLQSNEMPKLVNDLFDFLKKTEYYSAGELLYLMPYAIDELGIK